MADSPLDGLEVAEMSPGCWRVAWWAGNGRGRYVIAYVSAAAEPADFRAAILEAAERLRAAAVCELY